MRDQALSETQPVGLVGLAVRAVEALAAGGLLLLERVVQVDPEASEPRHRASVRSRDPDGAAVPLDQVLGDQALLQIPVSRPFGNKPSAVPVEVADHLFDG